MRIINYIPVKLETQWNAVRLGERLDLVLDVVDVRTQSAPVHELGFNIPRLIFLSVAHTFSGQRGILNPSSCTGALCVRTSTTSRTRSSLSSRRTAFHWVSSFTGMWPWGQARRIMTATSRATWRRSSSPSARSTVLRRTAQSCHRSLFVLKSVASRGGVHSVEENDRFASHLRGVCVTLLYTALTPLYSLIRRIKSLLVETRRWVTRWN
eukprot:49116-Prorocentrum_minimum.AAC.2